MRTLSGLLQRVCPFVRGEWLRFIKICPGPCWSLSVLLKKMDGSAAPMLLPGILIQATAFPYPAIALTSKLSGVMNFCIASLGGGCYIFCSLSTRHVTGMGSGSCCMFNAVRCFCLQELHSLPGSSCPAIVMQGKEAFPGSSCQVLGGWPCVKGSQDLFLPCHAESCRGVSLAACEVGKGCLGCCSTVCFCTVGSLV